MTFQELKDQKANPRSGEAHSDKMEIFGDALLEIAMQGTRESERDYADCRFAVANFLAYTCDLSSGQSPTQYLGELEERVDHDVLVEVARHLDNLEAMEYLLSLPAEERPAQAQRWIEVIAERKRRKAVAKEAISRTGTQGVVVPIHTPSHAQDEPSLPVAA